MPASIFDATAIPVLEQSVNFAQARHDVLASNIANMDTPGYRVRDLSTERFQERLKLAITERDRRHVPISPGEVSSLGPDPFASVNRSKSEWLHHDDTNGSLEAQVSSIAKNQLQHNVALALLTSQLRLLQTAISERA